MLGLRQDSRCRYSGTSQRGSESSIRPNGLSVCVQLEEAGWIQFDGTILQLTPKGRLAANSVIEELLWPTPSSTCRSEKRHRNEAVSRNAPGDGGSGGRRRRLSRRSHDQSPAGARCGDVPARGEPVCSFRNDGKSDLDRGAHASGPGSDLRGNRTHLQLRDGFHVRDRRRSAARRCRAGWHSFVGRASSRRFVRRSTIARRPR